MPSPRLLGQPVSGAKRGRGVAGLRFSIPLLHGEVPRAQIGCTKGAEPRRILVPPVAAPGNGGARWVEQTGQRPGTDRKGWESDRRLDPQAPLPPRSYLQAMDEPGMSLLDQSVIKKGKEWRVSARAEPGEMVQALGAQINFFSMERALCIARLGSRLHSSLPGRGAVKAGDPGRCLGSCPRW